MEHDNDLDLHFSGHYTAPITSRRITLSMEVVRQIGLPDKGEDIDPKIDFDILTIPNYDTCRIMMYPFLQHTETPSFIFSINVKNREGILRDISEIITNMRGNIRASRSWVTFDTVSKGEVGWITIIIDVTEFIKKQKKFITNDDLKTVRGLLIDKFTEKLNDVLVREIKYRPLPHEGVTLPLKYLHSVRSYRINLSKLLKTDENKKTFVGKLKSYYAGCLYTLDLANQCIDMSIHGYDDVLCHFRMQLEDKIGAEAQAISLLTGLGVDIRSENLGACPNKKFQKGFWASNGVFKLEKLDSLNLILNSERIKLSLDDLCDLRREAIKERFDKAKRALENKVNEDRKSNKYDHVLDFKCDFII